jgi:hypothetical protein
MIIIIQIQTTVIYIYKYCIYISGLVQGIACGDKGMVNVIAGTYLRR